MTLSATAKILVGLIGLMGLVLLTCFGAVAGTVFFGAPFLAAFIIFLALTGATLIVTTVCSLIIGAPFVPTGQENVREMIRMAGLQPGERLVDLGSGDGRILIAAAKAGASADGWEISPFLWSWSVLMIRLAGLRDRARAHLGSYWGERFDRTDVVTLFLVNTQMRRMEKKLRAELRPGSRVVSYAFKFPNWEMAAWNGRGMYLYLQAGAADRSEKTVKDS